MRVTFGWGSIESTLTVTIFANPRSLLFGRIAILSAECDVSR